MERLRKKGFLNRSKVDGLFQYTVKFEQEKVLHKKVSDFIERTLGGSISPLFNYFSESTDLTADEIRQLKKIADKIARLEDK